MAFPISVAPKKVQKGTRKWPHVIPARSNNGFGIWRNREYVLNIRNEYEQLTTIIEKTTLFYRKVQGPNILQYASIYFNILQYASVQTLLFNVPMFEVFSTYWRYLTD